MAVTVQTCRQFVAIDGDKNFITLFDIARYRAGDCGRCLPTFGQVQHVIRRHIIDMQSHISVIIND